MAQSNDTKERRQQTSMLPRNSTSSSLAFYSLNLSSNTPSPAVIPAAAQPQQQISESEHHQRQRQQKPSYYDTLPPSHHICPICSIRASTKQNLALHLPCHDDNDSRPFKCRRCYAGFAKDHGRKLHQNACLKAGLAVAESSGQVNGSDVNKKKNSEPPERSADIERRDAKRKLYADEGSSQSSSSIESVIVVDEKRNIHKKSSTLPSTPQNVISDTNKRTAYVKVADITNSSSSPTPTVDDINEMVEMANTCLNMLTTQGQPTMRTDHLNSGCRIGVVTILQQNIFRPLKSKVADSKVADDRISNLSVVRAKSTIATISDLLEWFITECKRASIVLDQQSLLIPVLHVSLAIIKFAISLLESH